MKGISTTLIMIVSVIVIAATSVIILVLTSGGFAPASDLLIQRNICLRQASVNCGSMGELPSTWENTIQYWNGEMIIESTCQNITGCDWCDNNERTGEFELEGCTVPEQ